MEFSRGHRNFNLKNYIINGGPGWETVLKLATLDEKNDCLIEFINRPEIAFRLLKEKGINVNYVTFWGSSLVIQAARANNIQALKILYNHPKITYDPFEGSAGGYVDTCLYNLSEKRVLLLDYLFHRRVVTDNQWRMLFFTIMNRFGGSEKTLRFYLNNNLCFQNLSEPTSSFELRVAELFLRHGKLNNFELLIKTLDLLPSFPWGNYLVNPGVKYCRMLNIILKFPNRFNEEALRYCIRAASCPFINSSIKVRRLFNKPLNETEKKNVLEWHRFLFEIKYKKQGSLMVLPLELIRVIFFEYFGDWPFLLN